MDSVIKENLKMKKLILIIAVLLTASASFAQCRKAVSILGDSYSTFEGFMTPATNELWYYGHASGKTDVDDVTQTWWHQFIKRNGYKLCVNNSYSGATISYLGYNANDYSDRSFITRLPALGSPDILLIFGGTNDSWAKVPMGEYKFSGLRKDDFYAYRPALAYLLDQATKRYPNVEIYFIMNDSLTEELTTSSKTICQHYGVPFIQLNNIDKQAGHPTQKGMTQIADQLTQAIASLTSTAAQPATNDAGGAK